MNIQIVENDDISPEAKAATKGLAGFYGLLLFTLNVGIYNGIIISGVIIGASDIEVNPTGSTVVWTALGVSSILLWRELAPVIWMTCKNIYHNLFPPHPTQPIKASVVYQQRPPIPKPPKLRRTRQRHGHVYLIQAQHDPSLYKIGRSANPDDRIRTFEVKLPFTFDYICTIKSDDMYTLERQLHYKYRDKRIDGEWFRLSTEDVEYIKRLATS